MPKRTKGNNINKIFLCNETLKEIEHIFRDVAGFDMSYDEFKELCRKSWENYYNCLCIDRFLKKIENKEDIVFVMKPKKRV